MAKSKKSSPSNQLAGVSEIMAPYQKDRESIDIHKIDNGYILRRSGVRSGRFFESELYTSTKPKIQGITKPVRKK